jgi:UPF0755 protein
MLARIKTLALEIREKLKVNKTVLLLRWKLSRIHPLLAKNFFSIFSTIGVVFVIYIIMYGLFWRAPRPFPEHILVSVEKGQPLSEIAGNFEREHVVISSLWLRTFIFLKGGEKKVIAGDYYIPRAKSVFGIANMITGGDFGLTPVRVLIPGGLNAREMSEIIGSSLPRFDKNGFADSALDYEGYLFPDTYFFMQNVKPQDIIGMMRENFSRKVEPFEEDVVKFEKPFEEDVIMASILEDEANKIEDKRIIAGILWKRIKLGMPLQVDSTLRYVTGKGSADLTKDDLADDNDYNTYKNKGLPPTPISNPGLDSIRAAITPTNTKYLYFLSDKNGVMHYAETFDQHKQNRLNFLGK